MNENRRPKLTKQMPKDALLEMLETENIQKISLREMSGRADINRSTFYQHYSSPYDLLSEMEDGFLNMINAEITAKGENHIENTLKFLKEHMPLCRIFITEKADMDFQQKLPGLPVVIERFDEELKGLYETKRIYA